MHSETEKLWWNFWLVRVSSALCLGMALYWVESSAVTIGTKKITCNVLYSEMLFCELLWNVYIFSNMASENACALQSREKYYFSKQNITSNVLQT